MAKLGELEQHCGNCSVMWLCGEPYSEVCLCAREELADMTEKEYEQAAEALMSENLELSNKEIEMQICKQKGEE